MDSPSSQSGEMIAAPLFDLLNPEFEYESADVAEARDRSWFATTPHGIIVLRHREGLELLRDRRFVLGSERAMAKLRVTSGPLSDMWMDGMARAGATITPAALKAFCIERGPLYSHPRHIAVVSVLP